MYNVYNVYNDKYFIQYFRPSFHHVHCFAYLSINYCNNPKCFERKFDRQAWTNTLDPDQMPRNVCSSVAKRSTNNRYMYVCKYIGHIIHQSNWSGPFSLVVMMLDYRSRGTWFDPRLGHSIEVFSLQVYLSSYYNWLLIRVSTVCLSFWQQLSNTSRIFRVNRLYSYMKHNTHIVLQPPVKRCF